MVFRSFSRFLAGGLLLAVSGVFLAGCEDGVGLASTAATPDAQTGAVGIERDVERPDVFAVSEQALWDGRPSLGGVWVAYPDNTDPERVMIRNVDNGKSVVGALFRRERENPGPAIQLSSDAASALGVIAGTPVEISIVVLRRETIEIEAPEPEVVVPEADEPVQSMEAGAELAPITVVEEVDAAPVAAPAVAAAAAVNIGAMVQDVLASTPVAADTIAETAETVTPVAPVAAPVVPQGRALAKPFIQVGTFSSEQRANDLVTILENEGVRAEVRANNSGNRTLYRVVSGPSATRAERADRLRIIKALGFTDAFIFG